MRKHLIAGTFLALAGGGACIIPDTEIVVYSTQECGSQFAASTNWAWGYNGYGELRYITTIDEAPITQKWCLTPEEAKLMGFQDSWIYVQILDDIVDACLDRAIELELGQENCVGMASVAYSGTCPGKHEWCEATTESDDEVGMPP